MGVVLAERSVVSIGGPDRLDFLDGLLSCRTENLAAGSLAYGALLTPQGKIVTDLFVHAFDDRVALDVPSVAADDVARRLAMYKLRAAVTVERTTEAVVLGEGPDDPRGPLGRRTVAAGAEAGDTGTYHAARIRAGVPDAVIDFELGDAFPHDANMDITGGVDFAKGCFVGQEVVSRMRHRGTARRRTVIVEADADLPDTGTPVTVDGKVVGRLGTAQGRHGLAMVRIDRAGASSAHTGGVALRLSAPPGAPFALAGAGPAAAADEADAGAGA